MLNLYPTANSTSRPSAKSRSMQSTSDQHLSVCYVFTITRLNKGSYFCTYVPTAMTTESWHFYKLMLCTILLCQNFCFSFSFRKQTKNPFLLKTLENMKRLWHPLLTLKDDSHYLRVPEKSKQHEKQQRLKEGYWKDDLILVYQCKTVCIQTQDILLVEMTATTKTDSMTYEFILNWWCW